MAARYEKKGGFSVSGKKLNCWEFMKCGKEKGGLRSQGNSACPVAADAAAAGLNDGSNGGRLCWVVADACCRQSVQCSTSHHESSCYSCPFRSRVLHEEGLLKVCKVTGYYLRLVELTRK